MVKIAARLSWILLFVLVGACVPEVQKAAEIVAPTVNPVVYETVLPATDDGITEQTLRNMTYLSPNDGIAVQLVDGVYSDETMTLTLLPQLAIGDLNGDAIDDAAILLAENNGGTGTFVSLVVIASMNGTFDQVGTAIIDDRPVIESLVIQDEVVVLNAVVHGLNDAMVSPTDKVSLTYRLLENNFTLMKRSVTSQGGMERSISIESPQYGNDVSGTVRISGSMPVAPFENNLKLTILDQTGKEFYTGGFMVTSADIGAPGTFDNEIPVPAIPVRTWVKIELSELSMADGSVVTMDSVLVKIK
ncbi:MAG: hypothetical protein CVU42_12690 [Chloroflexi bacterium HGW-Chloroflexi-4]|jgi:hypothetical protein|nr:MAG: hypothetical protein CVU42_12690 [Chloroflexi bacterium HGW-Chloroflexi-4]